MARNARPAFEARAPASYTRSLELGGSMIQWNAELARRLACREEEKRQMAPLIRRFMRLAQKVRAEGFQTLEAEPTEDDDPLLTLGLRLVIEGLPEDALEDVLATYLVAENRTGWPFLRAC